MKTLVFRQLGGRRSKICRMSIHHNGSILSCGNIELKGSHMGLVLIKRSYIEILVGVGTCNLYKSLTVWHHPSRILF
jgi:hypothetical protein